MKVAGAFSVSVSLPVFPPVCLWTLYRSNQLRSWRSLTVTKVKGKFGYFRKYLFAFLLAVRFEDCKCPVQRGAWLALVWSYIYWSFSSGLGPVYWLALKWRHILQTILICTLSLLRYPNHFHIIDVVLPFCWQFPQIWRITQVHFCRYWLAVVAFISAVW